MNDIFKEKNFYPYGTKFKDHFRDFYDSVFVAYLPFFKVENQTSKTNNYSKSEKITFEQIKEEMEIFSNIPAPNAEIYSYSNENYPTDLEIYSSGKIIRWETIIKETKLNDATELNKALGTSIGALRQIFRKPELSDKLNSFTTENRIWHPTENNFDFFSKLGIYKTFKLFNKNEIIIVDEFHENTNSMNLSDLTEYEFSQKISCSDRYIYSLDKEILFTIGWDNFYFLITTDKNKVEKIISEKYFEGFLSDFETSDDWDYLPEELEKLLTIEKRQNLKSKTKKWWKFWES